MSTKSHTRNATPRARNAPKVASIHASSQVKLPPRPQGFRLPPVGVPYIPKSAVEARRTRAYRHAKLLQELEALRHLPDEATGPLPRDPIRLRTPKR